MAKFSKQLNQIELAEMKRPGQWLSGLGPGFDPPNKLVGGSNYCGPRSAWH